MRRKIPHGTREFRPLKITRDDYDELTAIIARDCRSMRVSFEDKKFEFSSLAELEKRPAAKVISMTISGSDPSVTFTIGRTYFSRWFWSDQNSLWADDNEGAWTVFIKLQTILEKRQRFIGRIFNAKVYTLLMLINLGLVYPAVSHFISKHTPPPALTICALTITAYSALFFSFVLRGMSVIDLRPASETKTFWRENRDKIYLAVISALIGGLLTWVFHRFLP